MTRLTCFSLLCVIGLTHAALPDLLAVIYGGTAAASARPLSVLLFLALGMQRIKAARHPQPIPSLYLGTCALFSACLLRVLRKYLQCDVVFIDSILQVLGIDTLYTPEIASTLLECLFLGPLLIALASNGDQIANYSLKSLLILPFWSPVMPAGVLFALPIMGGLAALATTERKHTLPCVLLLTATLFLLRNLQTVHCSALPWLLQCPTTDSQFKILSQQQSQTGHVSVLESPNYRILKADHSLLGGEWQGASAGQSIFATFYMQAMGIYTTPHTYDTGFKTTVLLIGLGIGTSAKTILASPVHDVLVEAAELDCAVVAAAHDYFDLPRSDERLKVRCQDALVAVDEAFRAGRKFDLISHDIFTGGGVAYPLFTVQFFAKLRSILSREGTLSVNYVWSRQYNDLALQSLVKTLKKVFSIVEIYLENGKMEEMNNLVIVCKLNKALVLNIPDSGRAPISNLGTVAREMKDWHFDLDITPEAIILQDPGFDQGTSKKLLAKSSQTMALRHWRLMRSIFPSPESRIWTFF